MLRVCLSCCLLLIAPDALHAQDSRKEGKDGGPASPLGLNLGKVPEVLYAQVPAIQRGSGVVIERVSPGSAAARAGLLRHDILLSLDGALIDSPSRFLELLKSDQKHRAVPLVVLRGGKPLTLTVALSQPRDERPGPTALLKPGGPPAVTVEAMNLAGEKLSVIFTYYSKEAGKLERVTCSGSLDDIKHQVKDLARQQRMSPRVHDLADVALERLRVIHSRPEKIPKP
jgi:hypothetical protein